MKRTWLRVRAPFAAYRWMQAGVYRATFPTIPFSAARGLVLNLAGIETRGDRTGITTLPALDAPCVRLAIGAIREPEVATVYQQLHGYPVGNSGEKLKPLARGSKYWISPARREVLVGLDVMIGVESADPALPDRIERGLRGELAEPRYGLPFAGDNSFLFDSIDVLGAPIPVRWLVPVQPGGGPSKGANRLTIGIDREDSSKTTTVLMAPMIEATEIPPDSAWVWTPERPS